MRIPIVLLVVFALVAPHLSAAQGRPGDALMDLLKDPSQKTEVAPRKATSSPSIDANDPRILALLRHIALLQAMIADIVRARKSASSTPVVFQPRPTDDGRVRAPAPLPPAPRSQQLRPEEKLKLMPPSQCPVVTLPMSCNGTLQEVRENGCTTSWKCTP